MPLTSYLKSNATFRHIFCINSSCLLSYLELKKIKGGKKSLPIHPPIKIKHFLNFKKADKDRVFDTRKYVPRHQPKIIKHMKNQLDPIRVLLTHGFCDCSSLWGIILLTFPFKTDITERFKHCWRLKKWIFCFAKPMTLVTSTKKTGLLPMVFMLAACCQIVPLARAKATGGKFEV